MPQITYIEHDGTQHRLDVPSGNSVMQGAVDNALDNLQAECGGAMACATCHVYVGDAWTDKFPARDAGEEDMLECIAAERKSTSRLSCQLQVSDDMDGLVIHLPETQY